VPQDSLHGRAPWLLKLLAGLLVAAFVLGCIEVGLRAAGFTYKPAPPLLIWNSKEDVEMQRSDSLHRVHPYWFWELRPSALVPGCGDEHINSAGFRGAEASVAPPTGITRVVALGDSSTFGMGVCGQSTYAAVLQQALPGYEVLNFGVIGFSAFQGEKLFELRASRYRPNLVLAAFGAVDELLPALDYDVDTKFKITSQVPPWMVRSREMVAPLRIVQMFDRVLSRGVARTNDLAIKTEGNWQRWNHGLPEYRRNQSVESFKRSLRGIADTARQESAVVLLILPPRRSTVETRWPWSMEYIAAIEQVARELNVATIDIRSAFRAVPNADADLFVDDYHPNPAGHHLYAEILARKIQAMRLRNQ